MTLEFDDYPACCGMTVISKLYEIDAKKGGIAGTDYHGRYISSLLKERIMERLGQRLTRALSWIGTTDQLAQGHCLARAVRKMGYTVKTVDLGKNPGTCSLLTMWIAVHKNNKKKKKSAKPVSVRRRSVPQ